jgi:hypothetical protein
MFGETLAGYVEWTPAALNVELERLELEARALDARRLAVRAAAEARQTPALDGHKSLQAYLRATCNQPSQVARAEVRRARICRDFPQVGESLMAGRIGVGQIDELVRIRHNARAAAYLDDAAVDMLLDHAEHLPMCSFRAVVERWLMWADPDGAWHDQSYSIDHRSAHVIAANGELSIGVSGGDTVTAEAMRNIFAHFVEVESRKDCQTRHSEHGDRADEFPLPPPTANAASAHRDIFFAYTATGDSSRSFQHCLRQARLRLMGAAGGTLARRYGRSRHVDTPQIDAVLGEFVNDPTAMLTRRCETSSGQQIAPQLLIQALLTAQVRRVVVDANSTVIDLGERKRLFTGNARIAATLLERFCQHPGCEVPADRCQIDHNESHTDGGRTDQSNAGPECGPHNRHKYTHGWRTRRADNGRTYNIRSDGTLILVVGERPPPFTRADLDDDQRRGLDYLEAARERIRREYSRAA